MIIQTEMSIKLYLVFSSLCFSTDSLVYSLRKETVPDCYRLCNEKHQVQNGSKCNETSTGIFNDLCGTEVIFFINSHCKKLCSTSTRHVQNDKIVRGSRKVQSVEPKDRWIDLPVVTGPPDICAWMKEQKCKECKAGEICFIVNHDCTHFDNFIIVCIDTRMPSVSVALQNNTVNDSCNQTLYFMCTSDEITDAGPHSLFKMYWYIDGEEAYVSKTEYKSDIQKTYLTEFSGFYRLGVKVSCKYSSHLSFEDEGKLSPISDEFFAGIKILNTPITIEKDKQTLIKFQLTVPFGNNCNTGFPSTLTIEMRSPDSARCDGINGFDKCGMTIKSMDWNVIQSIVIKHSGNHKYQLTYGPQRRVQLRTKHLRVHPIWSNYTLPEIFIHIVNKSEIWRSKVCYSHSDPHMRTFDGKFYDNHNSGTFIMYESNDDKGNIMQVQTKLTYCNKLSGPGIMCNCAVAVRAAADVFLINRCLGDEEKFEFINCWDNVLDVRKEDAFNYKIYFPTGTHVHLRLWEFQTEMVIEVDIFPSVFDENVSKGLCSKLGSNALIGSDNTAFQHTQRPDAFSKSWIVPSKDNLIEMKNFENLDRMKGLVSVCTCKRRQSRSSKSFGDGGHVLCGKEAECPRGDVQITQNKCIVREKRNIKSSFTYIPKPIKISKRSLGVVKTILNQNTTNMMTYKEALDFCKSVFNASIGFQACSQLSILEHDKYIADCALDIELTNSTAWASASLEGYKNRCMNELKQNNTLQRENNSSSIADTIRRALCKNECSGHGSCIEGNCLCDENFGAADCSQDLRDPPSVYAVNRDIGGLCDERDCLEVNVIGDMFLDESVLACKFTRFQASLSNEKVFFESRSTNATHNTLSNIDCEVPKDWKNITSVTSAVLFVTGFTVSVSNDGRHFSTGQPLYILDSICQDTINIDGNLGFILKKNFCFIRGICVANATVAGPNNCSICISELNSFDWTVQYDRHECKILDSNNHVESLIVAICLIGIATIFVLFLIVMLKVFKHKSDAEAIFSRPPPHYYAPKPKFNMSGL